ncbi:MAG: WecB/TagA/CpsF family glycosyltransferase [Candidatus Riflebacteria bacterium]|nr:WecB/TagA/CpsF family glycosyltransferase [Candidatus Riflebacteria bacterium]
MLHPLAIYVVTLVICLGWLDVQSRFLTRLGLDANRWRDLSAYGGYLFLLVLFSPQTTSLAAGLVAASAILALGGGLAFRQNLGERGLRLAEVAAYLCLIRAGVEIHFIQRPSGGYLFLDGWSALVTLLWCLGFATLLRVSRTLPGLCPAVLALLSTMLLGALLIHQRGVSPDSTALALVLTASTTALWLDSHRDRPRRTDPLALSLWAMSLAVLPVVSATKRIALVSLVTPVLVLLAPIIFFTFVMATSYLGPHFASRNGTRWAFRWNLSLDRAVDLVMLFCLMGNSLVLVHLFTGDWLWVTGLAVVSSVLFWRLVSSVLFLEKTDRKSLGPGESIDVLGIRFTVQSFEHVIERIEKMIGDGRSHYIITPDALSILRTVHDKDYRRVVRRADMCVPDGAGVVWAADVLYDSPLLERVPGVDLVDRLAALAERRNWGLYLLGARPEVLPEAVTTLRQRHPALRIVGSRHGYFTADEEPAIRDEINRLRPDIVLVAMGVPKQEFWIAENVRAMQCSLMMGVGGTFDVLAGTAVRAPVWLRSIGLEWLYRVAREPHRLTRILSLPVFVKEVLRAKLLRRSTFPGGQVLLAAHPGEAGLSSG